MTTTTSKVKQAVESVYVTGFCGVGSHEGKEHKSSTGAILRSCPVGGRIEMTDGSGHRSYGDVLCTCSCHSMSRQMEELTGVKFPAFSPRKSSPALSRLGLLSTPGATTAGHGAPGSVDVDRPTVVTASGARFVVTPTGRSARGQLEEQVRHVISVQVKAAGEDMIAMIGLTTNTIAVLIDKDNQPSTGAIYSILKRWDGAAMVELADKPFRFLRFTDRGKRELLR